MTTETTYDGASVWVIRVNDETFASRAIEIIQSHEWILDGMPDQRKLDREAKALRRRERFLQTLRSMALDGKPELRERKQSPIKFVRFRPNRVRKASASKWRVSV